MSEAPLQGQLPLEVRLLLQKAAAIKDPMHRTIAIEEAYAKGRAMFPHFFHAIDVTECQS